MSGIEAGSELVTLALVYIAGKVQTLVVQQCGSSSVDTVARVDAL